ncbi:MAG: GNAT family N-acetyltransferase [Candidatus Nanopelagicales bacterium]
MGDVPDLLVVPADTAARQRDWRYVHNTIIPIDPLSEDDVAERAGRNRLEVAYAGTDLVGCSTVRRASDDAPVTVIVRVLPEHRGRGYGTSLYAHCMRGQRGPVQTVVLESNPEGLAFALRHGFVEVDRYVLNGDEIAYVELRRD